jgi:hypothetical protein
MKHNVNFCSKCVNYSQIAVENYLKDLRLVGSLSGLFSGSEVPLLHYRAAENLYCAGFGAENLARADVSVDAKLKTQGIGIKTFIETSDLQKVAEFNSQQKLYKDLESIDKIKKIAELRNKRLTFTLNAYELTELIYHCIVRTKEGFYLFEEKMHLIDIDSIRCLKEKNHLFFFTDGKAEYKFDASKSTLYKRFVIGEYFAFTAVDILTNPLRTLKKISMETDKKVITFPKTIIVPLYVTNKAGRKTVFPRSGLNQWNARGRTRDYDEVYVPFNSDLRALHKNFFPPRDTPFEVELPNGKNMSMKICQADGKALMSNPNKALGKWLLRDILNIPQGVVLTYDMLLTVGIDAVSFQKLEDNKYKIDFKQIGEFEKSKQKTLMTMSES